MTPNVAAAVSPIFTAPNRVLIAEVPDYHWFDVPLVVFNDHPAHPTELVRLPFQLTAVVVVTTGDAGEKYALAALCKQVSAGTVLLELLSGAAIAGCAHARVEGDELVIDHIVTRDSRIRDMANNCLSVLYSLHSAAAQPLHAGQVILHPKAAARMAQGRVPTYEWRTVALEPRAPRTDHKGGTHASPRQHTRRGHWATSKLGKRFWRPPCTVGKAGNGIVFHDYAVKGET